MNKARDSAAIAQLAGQNLPSEPTGMFAGFERMIAGRYLRARRKEAFISVIAGFSFVGIMLGVATLIIVMAVMNGFRAELLDKILGLNGHFVVLPAQSAFSDYDAVAKRFEKTKSIKLAVPLIYGEALVSSVHGGNSGAVVRGIREADFKRMSSVAEKIQFGSLMGFDQNEGVAIGTRMANNLGLIIGDELTLVSPEGDVTPFGTTPRVKSYPITAIFEIGMSEYDSTFIFMPFEEAQLYFNREGIASSIEIFTDDPDNIIPMRAALEDSAGRPVFVSDWTQRNKTFFDALEVERNVMFFILSLIVLVAALNIISGLFMLVKDKGRDIAILKTMGAGRAAIMRIFFMTGAAIGVFGTLAGFALGVAICLNIEEIRQFASWLTGKSIFSPELYFLSRLPAKIEAWETFSVLLMALGLSFLATIFPAWRAASIDPVEALRYE